MPEFISLRSFRLATLSGHVMLFEANVPRNIPDVTVADAMAAGCVPVDTKDIPYYEDVSRSKVEFQGDARRSTIYLAVKAIAEGNETKNFDAGGVPKHEVVAERLGYTVARDEVRNVYQQYLTCRSENRDFGLHPNAPNILRAIEADTKGELVDLAVEFGIDQKKASGLSARELRKLLLTKFNGNAAN